MEVEVVLVFIIIILLLTIYELLTLREFKDITVDYLFTIYNRVVLLTDLKEGELETVEKSRKQEEKNEKKN